MLAKNPDERLSIDEVINFPWVNHPPASVCFFSKTWLMYSLQNGIIDINEKHMKFFPWVSHLLYLVVICEAFEVNSFFFNGIELNVCTFILFYFLFVINCYTFLIHFVSLCILRKDATKWRWSNLFYIHFTWRFAEFVLLDFKMQSKLVFFVSIILYV